MSLAKRLALRRFVRSSFALAAAAALGGCFPIGSQEITLLDPPPLPFTVDDDAITITEGTALVARIAVLDEEEYLIDPAEITWTVSNANASIAETSTPGVYIVAGAKAGTATIDGARGSAGGDATITVTITPQTLP